MRVRLQINPYRINYFHCLYPWCPNEKQVRPSFSINQEKMKNLNLEISKYFTEEDFILHTVFKSNTIIENEKLVAIKNNLPKYVFLPNIYPYQVPEGTKHYIIWYYPDKPKSLDISNELFKLLKHDEFEFIFYENPKMNIKSIYHMQVFWKA